ncbi:MAG: hypothetical protein ACREBC_05295 [Pyrinomonadaceae bacterium]
MRVANCKRVRRDIEDIDAGQALTGIAKEHVEACAECQAFHDERLKLRQLVAGLGTVEAPPDFDFRLRARLANQKIDARGDFMLGRVSIALPSIAFAALVLLVGGFFAFRVWTAPTNTTTAVKSGTDKGNSQPGAPVEPGNPAEREIGSKTTKPEVAIDKGTKSIQGSRKQRRVSVGVVATNPKRNRPGTQEFSVTPATVLKRDTIASLEPSAIFPIEASSQPMKVSLDYATGVSRTISVPALSFGSQRVAGAGMSTVKTSARGVW